MSKNEVKVSVIIPCFNHGQFIMDAIASVEACQEKIWELIIVNDGSTDPDTIHVLQSLEQQGYLVINQTNSGLGAARNSGIKVATGEYILPLDSDNKVRPNYIYKSVEILDQFPDVGVVYGDANYFGEKTGLWKSSEFSLRQLLLRNFIDACAVFRKPLWVNCKYDESMPSPGWEDWDFWLSAAETGYKFYYIPEVLFDYRVRTGSMITQCKISENRKTLDEYVSRKHASLLKSEYQKLLAEHNKTLVSYQAINNELEQIKKSIGFSYIIYLYRICKACGKMYQKMYQKLKSQMNQLFPIT